MPSRAGPTQCYYCLENDPATCSANQRVQTCATDPSSLGTTHCGSGAGIHRDESGNTKHGVFRGCINCAGNKIRNPLVKHSYLKLKLSIGTKRQWFCQAVDCTNPL